jgi:hypothetical protein
MRYGGRFVQPSHLLDFVSFCGPQFSRTAGRLGRRDIMRHYLRQTGQASTRPTGEALFGDGDYSEIIQWQNIETACRSIAAAFS